MNCGISSYQDSLNQDLFPNMPITYPNTGNNHNPNLFLCLNVALYERDGMFLGMLLFRWATNGCLRDFENIFYTTLFFESRCSSKKGIRRGEWFIVVEMKLQIWKLWKMTLRWNNRLQALKILYGEDEQVFTIQMFFSFFSHL